MSRRFVLSGSILNPDDSLPSDVILLPQSSLIRSLQAYYKNYTESDARDVVRGLVQSVANDVCPPPTGFDDDALDGDRRVAHCVKFGDDEIDALLGGGIQTGSLTELVGERSVYPVDRIASLFPVERHPA